MSERICKHCGESIPSSRRPTALYCSPRCRQNNYFKEYHDLNPTPKLASGTVGAIGEYRVIVDLLSKGYDVFHAASPSCSCDLAVLRDGKLLKVEVRTAKYHSDSKFYFPKYHRADVLAVILPNKIVYQPSLEQTIE